MKCIQCDTENRLKDRTANMGRCKNCGHPFAFEPTELQPIQFTDRFFANTLSGISRDNTLFFTQKQFFYFLEKRLRKKRVDLGTFWTIIWGIAIAFFWLLFHEFDIDIGMAIFLFFWLYGIPALIILLVQQTNSPIRSLKERQLSARLLVALGIVLIGVASVFALNGSTEINIGQFVLGTIFGSFSIYWGVIQGKRAKKMVKTLTIQPDRVAEWLGRWMEVNGWPEKLLPPPQEAGSLTEISSDVSHYSFDRALICDRDEIAQFLIANNFHFEHNCAVLSIMGYPQNIFPTVMQMLRRNPDLKVFALHNATHQGILLPHTLRSQSEWFANTTAIVYDLGITPKQILKQPEISVFRAENLAGEVKNLPSEVKEKLSAEEIEWLEAGNYVELASFTPEKLLQIVTRGIADTRISDRELSPSDDPGNWESDDTSYIYISDSFG